MKLTPTQKFTCLFTLILQPTPAVWKKIPGNKDIKTNN